MSSFDDIIKQKADGHEAPVPPGAWQKIMPPKKKRRFASWFWLLASLIIAGVSTPAYLHWQNRETKQNPVAVIPAPEKRVPLQEKNNNPGNIAQRHEKSNPAATGNTEPATVPAIKQNNTDKADDRVTVTVNEEENLSRQNRKRLSTKAKTTTSIRAAELAVADRSKSNDPANNLNKNKPVTKQSAAKTTVKITAAQTGEALTDNPPEKSLPQQNKDELASTIEEEPSKEKNTVATIAAAKKQDSILKTGVSVTATANNSATKNRSLYVDLSIIPFFPIQQNMPATTLTRSTFYNNVLSEFKSRSVSTKLEPSVAFQLGIRKNVSHKWQIGTGIQYAQAKETILITGEETNTTYSSVSRLVVETNRSYLVTDTIVTTTSGTRDIKAVNSYQLISIPLFAQYKTGRLLGCNFSLTSGFFFNVYDHYSNSIDPVVSSADNTPDDKLGIDWFGGFRLSKLCGEKIELFGEPTIRFNINDASTKNALLNQQVQQFGIAVGAAIRLK